MAKIKISLEIDDKVLSDQTTINNRDNKFRGYIRGFIKS